MEKIQIEVNKEHLHLIISALDFYSRIGIGQFNHIKDHPTFEKVLYEHFTPKRLPVVDDRTPQGEVLEIKDGKALIAGSVKDGKWCKDHEWKPLEEVKISTDYSKYHERREVIDIMLNNVRDYLYCEHIDKNGSWGIHHPKVDESCREAYDLLQIFRHELWKNNPKRSSVTVDSHIHFSSKDKSMNEVKIKTLKDE